MTAADDKPRTVKIEFALSLETDVFILFNGPPPDAACFRRLHHLLALLEDSMCGVKLNPCEKHPDSYRDSKSNRCVQCMKDLAEQMNRKRREKRGLQAV